MGAPRARTLLVPGDLITLYGRNSALRELDIRSEGTHGDIFHQQAVAEQEAIVDQETLTDTTSRASFR